MGRRKNIYFERKTPGKDSIFNVVHDIGVVGCRNAKEVCAIAVAQLLDYLDGVTRDNKGRIVRFTKKKWAGRTRILRMLAGKFGGKRCVNYIDKLRMAYDAGKITKNEVKRLLMQLARKMKLPINYKALKKL